MKMAIQYFRNRGNTQKHRFVSFTHAYHGDTTGAMSLCDPSRSMHATFGNGILKQISVDLPRDGESLSRFSKQLEELRHEVAAVFLEPLVQGAGGMRFHSAETVRSIAECCRQQDILFVCDELATGFGRTGAMFAIDEADVTPDIICLGKALTGGAIGMAATVASDEVFDAFWSDRQDHALMHGPTFMANPLACAAANASLDLFESEPRLDQVAAIEASLSERLGAIRNLPRVVDVRVKGAIGAIQVDELTQLDRLRQEFIRQGVWVRPFGDCIYVTPPLVISESELEQLCDSLVSVTREWSQWDA